MCSLPMDHYIISMPLYGALHCSGSQEGGVLARPCGCAVRSCLAGNRWTKGCHKEEGTVFLDVSNV